MINLMDKLDIKEWLKLNTQLQQKKSKLRTDLKEKGILKSGIFVERGGMDLDGLGCVTAIRDAFLAARGGVLFIDEAYSMKSDIAVTA